MTSSWKAVLGVLLIFILGFAAGVVSTSIVVHRKVVQFLDHPGVVLMNAMEKSLTKNLDLDAKQKEQIHQYFMDNLRQHKQLQVQIQPQVAVLNETTVSQITAALRPDQQKQFSQNLDDLHKRYWKYASSPDPANPAASQPEAIGTNNGTGAAPTAQ